MSGKSFLGIDYAGGPDLSPEGQLQLQDGSAALPAMSFLSDPTLGLSKNGSTILTSVGGVAVATSSSTGLTLAGSVGVGNGTVSSPGMKFGSHASSGLYWDTSASGPALSRNGVAMYKVGSNSLTFDQSCFARIADGSSLAPGLAFAADTGLGLRRAGAGNMAISYANDDLYSFGSTSGFDTHSKPVLASSLYASGTLSASSVSTGTVSCTGVTATGPISCGNYSMGCGSLTTSGSIVCGSSIDCGINPMTCGALSSVSLDSGTGTVGSLTIGAATASNLTMGTSGIITAAIGDATAPSIVFAGDTKSGLCRASAGYTGIASGGSLVARFGASKGDMYVPLVMNGASISSGAFTASGTVSCGTNAMTCGAMSCTSLSSSGNVSFPQYYLRAYLAANQTLSSSVHTLILYDTVETTYGGNSGFSVSLPQGSFAAPVDGTYLVVAVASWDSTAGGTTRNVWIAINNPSASSARRYNMTSLGPPSFQSTAVAVFRLVAGDTIQSIATQNSGGNADLIGPGSSSQIFTSINILRVCA